MIYHSLFMSNLRQFLFTERAIQASMIADKVVRGGDNNTTEKLTARGLKTEITVCSNNGILPSENPFRKHAHVVPAVLARGERVDLPQ
jgi:hypothetical protein